MDRQDVLKRLLYPKCKTAIEFKFDSLIVNPLLSYITIQDIAQLHKIASSIKYSSKPELKYSLIDKILVPRGFKKMASGTNRVTYRCLNDYRIVLKVAIDKVGLSDNGNEYRNQFLLKPFVTKCFEVSPCGTVGLFERVVPITSKEEFINISDDIFDLINNLIGKYVLEDIGEKFYMNYGLREGFGPVLLDYPYVFELDGRKLFCNVPEPMSPKGYCGGEIDYDLGYNDLICKRCGKRYLATELKSDEKSGKPKIIVEGEDIIMKCVLTRGDEVVSKLNSEAPVATNTIKPRKEFSRLKAHISVKTDEEEKVDYKPTIKTHDDVQLKANLRGPKPKRDIDKEAREKEARIDAISEKIPVSFESQPEEKSEEKPVSDFSAQLSGVVKTMEKLSEETASHTDVDESDKKAEDAKPTYTYKIDGNGCIYDRDNLIGFTIERYHEQFKEATKEFGSQPKYTVDENSSIIYKDGKTFGVTIEKYKEDIDSLSKDEDTENESEEETTVAYSDQVSIATIGDAIAEKGTFKGNENYKTTDVVSPIEGHFAARDEEPDVEDVKETMSEAELKEVPELIINPRSEEEVTAVYADDEEYDPEYPADDEDDEKLIGEY